MKIALPATAAGARVTVGGHATDSARVPVVLPAGLERLCGARARGGPSAAADDGAKRRP
ncbi:hypothetical protein [Actinomadura sp. HBU206391]|uniref:hypothetical protein n=1 Tax=Actinomadura sp. HBU206391 TaxID=2731692 RepID=UPI001650AAFC|nr:hypothetical protein [Actinomadura sp. HBU206391]MBC6459136.1 hypothetical protein [Actinomadura sp. HBU206391]